MNTQARDKVIRGRAALLIEQPFFGSLGLRLKLREDTSIKTFATDGVDLVYSPDFVMKISPGQIKTEICHEIMHNVLDHIRRQGDRDHGRWNRATDYAINPLLKDLGMEMDDTYLLEDAFRGMSADHIYSIIPPGNPGGGGGGGQGQPAPQHVQPNPQAPVTPKQALDWKIATAQAAQAAKMMGKLPGPLDEFVGELMDSKVNWKDVLRQFATQAIEGDFHWMKPNRMMLGYHGICLPGLFSEKTKPIAVVKDISASIGDDIQDAFNAEILALQQDTRPEKVYTMLCDTRVTDFTEFGPDEPVTIKNRHGGGTSFIPPFEELEARGITPACLIYLTDMEGSFPTTPPDYPVLWVTIDKHSSEPPFGEMTYIEI